MKVIQNELELSDGFLFIKRGTLNFGLYASSDLHIR